jgi:hypothetical protein
MNFFTHVRLTLFFIGVIFISSVSAQNYGLTWSRYFGGSGNEGGADFATFPHDFQHKVDENFMYVFGSSTSVNLPIVGGVSATASSDSKFYFAKFERKTGILVYSTFIHGSQGNSYPIDMAIENGNAYLLGSTSTSGLPTTIGGGKKGSNAVSDYYLIKINTDNSIGYATYYGGDGAENAISYSNYLSVENGLVSLVGRAPFANVNFPITNFPITNGTLNSYISDSETLFAAKFNTNGSIIFSTFFPGKNASGNPISGLLYVIDAKLYNGDLYAVISHRKPDIPVIGTGATPPNANVSTNLDMNLVRFANNGDVTLCTSFGITNSNDQPMQLEIDETGIYVLGSLSASATGNLQMFKFNFNGSLNTTFNFNLVGMGTLTNVGTERASGQLMKLTDDGIYFSVPVNAFLLPATDGTTYQGVGSVYVGKVNKVTGANIWGSYISGNNITTDPSIEVSNGRIGVKVFTTSTSLAVTDGSALKGSGDLAFFVYNSQGAKIYGSYIGTSGSEGVEVFPNSTNFAHNTISAYNGCFYVSAGLIKTAGFPVTAGLQNYAGGTDVVLFSIGAVQDFPLTNTITPSSTNPPCFNGVMPTLVGNAILTTNGLYSARLQWQVANSSTGPWTDIPAAIDKNYTPEANAAIKYYRRVAYKTDCNEETILSTSNTLTVNAAINTAPTVNAGGILYSCGTSVNLGGSPSATGGAAPYTYSWTPTTNIAGSTTAANTTTISGLTSDAVFTLLVRDNNGCIGSNQAIVKVVSNASYPNGAGADVSYCAGGPAVQIGKPGFPNVSGITYSWSPSSGLSCTNCAQPLASPTSTTTYTVTYTVPLQAGGTCTLTDNVVVTVVNRPNANFGGPDKVVCLGNPTTTTLGTAAQVGYTYTWSPGSFINNNQIANPTLSIPNGFFPQPDNPTVYLATATQANCSFYDTVKIYVMEAYDMAGIDGCGPRVIGLPERTPNINETYAWTRLSGNGTFLGSTTTKQTTVSGGTGTTTYRLTSSFTLNGTTYTCTDDVVVPPCGCNIIVTIPFTGCAKGVGAKLVASSLVPSEGTYTWAVQGGGPNAGLNTYTGPEVTLTDNVPRVYVATYTNLIDPSLTCSVNVPVNQANFNYPVYNAPNVTACPNTAANLGLPNVAGYNYTWSPADGLSSTTISNPTSTTAGSNIYYVTVADQATGCITNDTVVVTRPTVTANGSDKNVCSTGAIVTLGEPDPSAGAWNYSWTPAIADYRNGTNANSIQPDVFVSGTNGTVRTFTLTVTEPTNNCTATKNVNVTVSAAPIAAAGADKVICAGSSTTLGTGATIANVQYSWSPTTGLSNPNILRPIASPTATTTYTLTTSFPGGCSTSDQVLVTVNPLPTPTVTTPATYCAGTGTILNASSGFTSYSWWPTASLSASNIEDPTTFARTTTTYTLEVTDANGCKGRTTVTATASSTTNAGEDKITCINNAITIGATGNIGTISWNLVSGPATYSLSNTSIAQPSFTATAGGVYKLQMVKVNGTCTTRDTMVVTVPTIVVPDISVPVICQNGCTTIPLTAEPGKSYLWSPISGLSDAQIANPVVCVGNTSKSYNVIVTDEATNCSVTKNVAIPVANRPAPQIAIAANTLCAGSSSTINATITNGLAPYKYKWSPANGLVNATVEDPTVNILTAGNYTYTLQVTDANNCIATNNVSVTVNQCIRLAGHVWNDVNNNITKSGTEPYINGTNMGAGVTTGAVLYVNLLDANGIVVATTTVDATGNYSFNSISSNSSYTLQLNQNQGVVGQPAPMASLPVSWAITGENKNTEGGLADNVRNGLIPVVVGTTNIENQDFGINQKPESAINVQTTQPNPGGVLSVAVPKTAWVFSETNGVSNGNPNSQDYSGGRVDSIRITSFPTNTNTFIVNGVNYTSSNWPVNGVTIAYIDGYGPLVPIELDPIDGITTSVITFVTRDNAKNEDATPGSITLPFSQTLSVNFVKLTAEKQQQSSLVSWQLADERNILQYEIERSENGRLFTKLGVVLKGNNVLYKFTDNAPLSGINYYRIKAVETDGSFKYSVIVKVSFTGKIDIEVYPNPVSENMVIVLPEALQRNNLLFQMVNAAGAVVLSKQVKNASSQELLQVSALKSGYYILKIIDSKEKQLHTQSVNVIH